MSIRYNIGKLFRHFGYRISADYKWPTMEGNLVAMGLTILRARNCSTIQIVQVGAFDGLACDPLSELLTGEDVVALLVEPQAASFEKLQTRYAGNARVSLVNAALTERDGYISLWIPGVEASPKASVDPEHHARFGLRKADLREVVVPAISVESLLRKVSHQTIDLLQIDTEGMDLQILKLFFKANRVPPVVNFESIHLSRRDRLESRQLLRQRGYWWIETDQDTFAIQQGLITGR